VKTKTEMAVEKFLSGYNCAQSILYAFGPDLGLDAETALKVSTGLGGGMGGRGEVCGAVTGGILALGLKYGRGEKMEKSVAQQAYQKTGDLMAAFERAHGSCTCRTLLCGCDLRTPEGMQQFREQDLHHKVCVGCVRTVGDILAGMLAAPALDKSEARDPKPERSLKSEFRNAN
jgi:C_GCAxxG_C_C family probable redox protein